MGQQWVKPTTTCRTKPRTRPRSPADLGTPSTLSPRRSPASPQVPGCCGRSFPGPNAALAVQRLTLPAFEGLPALRSREKGRVFFRRPKAKVCAQLPSAWTAASVPAGHAARLGTAKLGTRYASGSDRGG